VSGPSGPVVVVDEGYEGVTQDEGRQLLAVRCRFVAPNISGDGKYVGWLAPTLTWEGLTIRPQNWRLWTLANDFTIFMATGDW
jgi:hypothetical protein